MSRWRAFVIHLLTSATIVAVVAGSVLVLWYPPEMFRIGNLGRLIGLIAIVDVVVGPIITLIIFRSGKPGLKLDLIIIAVTQIALLAYGLHLLIANRPVYMVWVGDRFELVTPRDIADEDLALASDEFSSLSWTGPVHVAAIPPVDAQARETLTLESLQGRDIHVQPRYFRTFDAVPASDLQRIEAIEVLVPHLTSAEAAELAELSAGKPPGAIKYAPITNATREAGMMLIDAQSGRPVDVFDLDPWVVKARSIPPQ